MTQQRDLERLLERWFSDGPSEAPDRVVDAVADRIERQPQRPAWRPLRRETHVSMSIRAGAALAAVVIVAVVGFALLPRSSNGVGGPASAAPSPSSATPSVLPSPAVASASPSAGPIVCEDGLSGCAGPLIGTSHRSRHFDPRLYFDVPAGWKNVIDAATIYKLDRADTAGVSILVWSHASIALQSPSCAPAAKPRTGSTAADWIAFVTSHPGLVSAKPTAVNLDGSKGWSIDLTVAPGWTSTCPSHPGPYVMLLTNGLGGEYGVPSDQRLHLVVVDNVSPSCGGPVADCTKTVVIEVYGPSNADAFAASTAAARSIIDSFSLGCGPAFCRNCSN